MNFDRWLKQQQSDESEDHYEIAGIPYEKGSDEIMALAEVWYASRKAYIKQLKKIILECEGDGYFWIEEIDNKEPPSPEEVADYLIAKLKEND